MAYRAAFVAVASAVAEFAHHAPGGHGAHAAHPVDPCETFQLGAEFGEPTRGHPQERILVTGGSGFIGSNLVEKLLELGYWVRVLDNLVTGYPMYLPLQHPHLELIIDDATKAQVVRSAMKNIDGVIHLAAMSKVLPSLISPKAGTESIQTNVDSTALILQEAQGFKVHKVVYAASSTYYGNGKLPYSEDGPHVISSPYATSKYMGELMMNLYDNLYDLRTLSLRFFMVYGPRQPREGNYAVVTGKFLDRLLNGEALRIEGDGSQSRDFIHVDDIVRGIILGYQSKVRSTVINLGSGKQISVKALADLISSNQSHVPARAHDLRATLADTCRAKRLLSFQARREITEDIKELVQMVKRGEDTMKIPPFWSWPETQKFFNGTIDGWAKGSFEEKNAKLRSESGRNPVFLSEAVRLIRRSRHEEL
jgi:nucleoside-diphosphate-sugar epimerase